MVRFIILLAVSLLLVECRTITRRSAAAFAESQNEERFSIEEGLKQCVALRGNGPWVGTHFASLARATEVFGRMDGIAGGSSSTVSALFYESIFLNPLVDPCLTNDQCDPIEKNGKRALNRAALLLKSAYGYFNYGRKRVETSLATFSKLSPKTLQESQRLVASRNINNASDFLNEVHEAEKRLGVLDFFNPDFVNFLMSSKAPISFRRSEGEAAVKSIGVFKIPNRNIFFRPGVINFAALARILGRFADFYAARFMSEELKQRGRTWFEQCADASAGLSWEEISRGDKSSCVDQFYAWMDDYLVDYSNQAKLQPNERSRIDEEIGQKIVVLIGTSVLRGEKVLSDFFRYRDEVYGKGHASELKNFDIPPQNLGFGYWSPSVHYGEEVKMRLESKYAHDFKSKKFVNLGQTTWRTAMQYSPAEPGLANIQQIKTSAGDLTPVLSAGGWSDLHPVQVLRAAECDRVLYVTASGFESDLPIEAMRSLLASTEAQRQAQLEKDLGSLYQLTPGLDDERLLDRGNPPALSSMQTALKDASVVWCTDWRRFTDGQILEMSEEAYRSRWVARDKSWLSLARSKGMEPTLDLSVPIKDAAPQGLKDVKLRGCVP